MKKLLVILAAGVLTTAGAARGGESTFAVVPGPTVLPSAVVPNGSELVLAPSWLARPPAPAQLSNAQLLGIWKQAGEAYGVPWNVLAAINKIESNFGRNMGPSSAGAIGWMQFMPSTWLRWGLDADADGTADPWSPVDAIYSAARYLAASGGSRDIRQAVFSYNHAWWYVNEVLELAQVYGGSGWKAADAQPVFALDQLQQKLAEAQASVTKAADAYQASLAIAEKLEVRDQALTSEAAQQPLLSDRLDGEKRAAALGAQAYAAQADADRLKAELDAARTALARLRDSARSASFNRPAARLLASASQSSGSYIFPVGGGPAVVSVSHYHHDYPAADIAAPEGTPLYALADGAVLHAWSWDDRCGIGFTMQALDGQVWTYCHLSYMDPSVTDGAQLTAGDPVGLVGATGHATGPHLHLQLQPAALYPQSEDWFQSFAGLAFRWTDEAPVEPGVAGRPLVFHIVDEPTD